jgi:hypothetical protein
MPHDEDGAPSIELTQETRDLLDARILSRTPRHMIIREFGCTKEWLIEYGKDFWKRHAETLEQTLPRNILSMARTMLNAQEEKVFDHEARSKLIDATLQRAELILDGIGTPQELQQFAVAIGILIDKKRLEDGEATSRPEVTASEVRESISRRIAELASRRGEIGDSGSAVG